MGDLFTIEMFGPGYTHGYTVFVGTDEAFASGVLRRIEGMGQPPADVRYELVRWVAGVRQKPEPATAA
jgi:hypothetical protein